MNPQYNRIKQREEHTPRGFLVRLLNYRVRVPGMPTEAAAGGAVRRASMAASTALMFLGAGIELP